MWQAYDLPLLVWIFYLKATSDVCKFHPHTRSRELFSLSLLFRTWIFRIPRYFKLMLIFLGFAPFFESFKSYFTHFQHIPCECYLASCSIYFTQWIISSGFPCSVLVLCVNTFACSVTWMFYQHKQSRIGMYLFEKAVQFSVLWWSIWYPGAKIK